MTVINSTISGCAGMVELIHKIVALKPCTYGR
jgi:hypothetical protein